MEEMLVNNIEYVGKRLSTNSGVLGRLKKPQFADYEDVLKADAETMAVVRHGYIILSQSMPPVSSDTKNNGSCIWLGWRGLVWCISLGLPLLTGAFF